MPRFSGAVRPSTEALRFASNVVRVVQLHGVVPTITTDAPCGPTPTVPRVPAASKIASERREGVGRAHP